MQASLCDTLMSARCANDHLLRRYMIESSIAICTPKLIESGELFFGVLGFPVRVDGVLGVLAYTHVDASGC